MGGFLNSVKLASIRLRSSLDSLIIANLYLTNNLYLTTFLYDFTPELT